MVHHRLAHIGRGGLAWVFSNGVARLLRLQAQCLASNHGSVLDPNATKCGMHLAENAGRLGYNSAERLGMCRVARITRGDISGPG